MATGTMNDNDSDINEAMDDILNDMHPNEVSALQSVMDDNKGGDDDDDDAKGGGGGDEKGGDDDDDAKGGGGDEKGGDDNDNNNNNNNNNNNVSNNTQRPRTQIRSQTRQRQQRQQVVEIEEPKLSIDELLSLLNLDAKDITEKLTILGSNVGLLGDLKKRGNFSAIKGILEGAQSGGADATAQFQGLVRSMLQTESQKYAKCALQFINLLGYTISNSEEEIVISGAPDESIIATIKSNFHHLSNAMQKPVENIYQQLKLTIPPTEQTIFHKSGILDNEFIIFQLIEIVLESQQASLVNKNVLDPTTFERFVNFLCPNSCKYLCREIYFEKLSKMNLHSIGLFGSKFEILDMLTKYNAISKCLYNSLINDKENRYLRPGIHAILPINIQKGNNFNKWDNVIYIFYWSLPNSFNMKKMKEVKYMRKDPSCLLTRVLYEISSTVCIQVSTEELEGFGLIYELDEDGKEKKYDKKSKQAALKRKQKINKRRGRGRQKLDFKLEETKENMVIPKKEDTNQVQIEIKIIKKDERWMKFTVGDKIGALDSTSKWYLAEILRIKSKTEEIDEFDKLYDQLKSSQQNSLWRLNKLDAIYVHYCGWSKKWDEWVFIEEYTCCDCIGDDCNSFMHRLKPREKQDGGNNNNKKKESKWKKMGGSWVTGAVEKFNQAAGFGNNNNNNNKKDKIDEEQEDDDDDDKDDDDDDAVEYDFAHDTFLLNGTKMSSYVQLFEQEQREDFRTIDFVGLTSDQLKDFYIDLNKTNIIEWKKEFVSRGAGIDYLGWALCPGEYEDYEQAKTVLDKEEERALENDNIKEKVDEMLNLKQMEILYEFHKFYTSKKYCKGEHKEIEKLINNMNKNGKLNQEITNDALFFANVESKETTLPKKSYSWFRDVCLDKMCNETEKLLKNFKKSKKNDASKNKFIKKWVNLYKEQLQYYADKVHSTVLHRASIAIDVKRSIEKDYNKKRYELRIKLEASIKILQDAKKPKTDENNNDNDTNTNKGAAPTATPDTTKNAAPTAVPPDAAATTAPLDATATTAPPNATATTAPPDAAATTAPPDVVVDKDATTTAVVVDKDKDKDKDEEMTKTTLTKFEYQEKRWNNASEKFIVTYTQPITVPPSYNMTFGQIDLPNQTTGNEDVRLSTMRNMKYEILQTDKLLFHQSMTGGETVMFIREDDLEMKTQHTKIIASTMRVLHSGKKPQKWLKNKTVQLVSYNESQKLFAVLMDDVLGFIIYQMGGRMQITNKRCELRDIAWWDRKMTFKALLIDEIDKNIFVWLIDEHNVVRAYDYDVGSWDAAKEFKLDQEYDSYQLLPGASSFLLAFKRQYKQEEVEEKKEQPPPTPIEIAKTDLLNDCSTLILCIGDDTITKTDTQCIAKLQFTDPKGKQWFIIADIIIDASNKQETLQNLIIKEKENENNELKIEIINFEKIYNKMITLPEFANVICPPKPQPKPVPPPKKPEKKITGRIELHTFLLLEKKKLEYEVHKNSFTGYETGNELELVDKKDDDDEDEKKDEEKTRIEFKKVDNVLIPDIFSCVDDYVRCKHLKIQQATGKDDMILCTIAKDGKLLYHPLSIQISETRLTINRESKKTIARKITKLDYMEYMVEKFGSRAAIAYPEDVMLSLHTTYIMKDEGDDGKDSDNLCQQISEKIMKSLMRKEKKNFEYLDWECATISRDDYEKNTNKITAKSVLGSIQNGKKVSLSGDAWMKNLIVQIPVQIARGVNNKFVLMYNGEDNQQEYIKATDSYGLCKAIRFGAYDGLIKSWQGEIKVVTSMGKQSTGKSYMLNHLFGTKFDISGGRCTDGGWLSVKIIDDILYVVCDFEGLGSFERSPQEDMLLATFNSAISNCTIFKCDNRFDRTVEDMFNKFQSGVKIMKGSQGCFTGELLLIIKDVVDTGAEAAVADFKRHIERLAQEAELVRNDKGVKESSFFVSQMYKSGLELIPYPPLANEAFFTELNDTLELAIDDIEETHAGGKIFLDHIKLVMAKLHIGDFSAMSGEQAKIRSQEIRDNIQYAVECGACVEPTTDTSQYGVTFKVDEDENLLLLDGNQLITVDIESEVIECDQIKNYKNIISEFIAAGGDASSEIILLDIVNSINDAGLILGKVETLEFLYSQFSIKITRKHNNHREFNLLYQCYLDIIYFRRKVRVFKFIRDNTVKFEDEEKREIESLIQSADSRLNSIRDKMKICNRKCRDCFYKCLLCKNHEDDNDWADEHTCYSRGGTHTCGELCDYCDEAGIVADCGDKCGHSGKHNCQSGAHTCGLKCSLSQYGGCQMKCNLEKGHDSKTLACKCATETHFCVSSCGVDICKGQCKFPYNKSHGAHICIQQTCPYKCQVQTWNDSIKEVTDCGRPCQCDDHDHILKMNSGECKDEGHTCDQEHPCPEFCTELGNCKVEIHRKIVEKEILITGAGSKIEYDSYADINAEKRRCCIKIPMGEFKHAEKKDDLSHKCYSGDIKDNLHTCEEKCDSCGYFCRQPYGHYFTKGTFHDCVHGNMRNTVFYATEEIVDTGDNRKYKVGDAGVAEMCNIFCERMGRGHIHLELCAYEGKWKNKRIAKSFIDSKNIKISSVNDRINDENISNILLANGDKLNGYIEIFKKCAKHENILKEKEEMIIFDWKGNSADLKLFLSELNTKFIISFNDSFTISDGMDILANIVAGDNYNIYNEEKDDLDKKEETELDSNKINAQTEEKIEKRKEEILIELFEFYKSNAYCQTEYNEIKQLFEQLKNDGKLKNDLNEVEKYLNVVSRNTTLPKDVLVNKAWFKDTCLNKMKTDSATILTNYKNAQQGLTDDSGNNCISEWLVMFVEQLEYYKDNVYGGDKKAGTILHKETIKSEIEAEIQKGFKEKKRIKLEELIKNSQKDKAENNADMKTIILTRCEDTGKVFDDPEKYILAYSVKVLIPSLFYMKFGTISTSFRKADLDIDNIRNTEYKIGQNDKMIFCQMIKQSYSYDIVMFICEQGPKFELDTGGGATAQKTKIILSNKTSLNISDTPSQIFDKQGVQFVAYDEMTKIFAILLTNQLCFAKYNGSGSISMETPKSELEKVDWWNSDLKFKQMFIEKIESDLFVWLIDENQVVHAFNFGSNSWEKAKEFKLDQKYDGYQIYPTGKFLIAFKRQIKTDIKKEKDADKDDADKNTNNDDDDGKDDEKDADKDDNNNDKEDKDKEDNNDKYTGRIEAHAFLLLEKQKLEYVVHSSSSTGHETGQEQDLPEAKQGDNEFNMVDNLLLPEEFSCVNDYILLNELKLQNLGRNNDCMVSTITREGTLLYTGMTIVVSKTSTSCVEEAGRRHQSKKYMPNPEISKDEVKHGKFWRRKKWKDPCVEKFRKLFDKCNYVCQHQIHDDRAAKGEKDIVKFCVESLWHKPMATPSGHTFNCKHPFGNAHIIFVCDYSGSMGDTDGGTSVPQFAFIRDAGNLNNRLGALYSAIHNFITVRLNKGCIDCLSAVMFDSSANIAVKQVTANENFVTDYLLKYTPAGGTNFSRAFNQLKQLVGEDENSDIIVIFLTDGEASDGGSSTIVSEMKTTLGSKFSLFCILLGRISERGNPVLEGIANAGGGTLLSALTGNELGTTFTSIAKQMNSGAFGKF